MPANSSALAPSRPRIHVLDFIRLIAMLMMIQGHTLDALVNPVHMDMESFSWQTWLGLRGLTAPLFLMVSGAVTVLGIRYDSEGRLSRALVRKRIFWGLAVMGIGYLLVFPASNILELCYVSGALWRTFFRVNILQLNGATLLLLTGVLAMTRSVRRYGIWSASFGFLILAGAPFISGLDWFRELPEGVAAYFTFSHGSLFPIFPASAYMFLGAGLGALLMESPEGERLRIFRLTSLIGSALFLGLALVAKSIPLSFWPPHDPYKAGLAYSLFRLGFALLLFGALTWISEAWPRLAQTLAPLGKRSLAVYIIHLVLLYGTPWTHGFATPSFPSHTLAAGIEMVFVVTGLTFGSIALWTWIKRQSLLMENLIKVSAVCVLAYALFF